MAQAPHCHRVWKSPSLRRRTAGARRQAGHGCVRDQGGGPEPPPKRWLHDERSSSKFDNLGERVLAAAWYSGTAHVVDASARRLRVMLRFVVASNALCVGPSFSRNISLVCHCGLAFLCTFDTPSGFDTCSSSFSVGRRALPPLWRRCLACPPC